MPDQDSSDRDPMYAVVNAFETEIGMQPGFLEQLLNDGDDWSFIIKLHALFEAAATQLITAAVGRQELGDLFASLTMGDTRKGKLAVASDLRLIAPRQVRFLRTLGRIRNGFVHDVKNMGLRIEEYVQSLKPEDQAPVWLDLIRGFSIEPTIFDFGGQPMPAEDFARKQPRFTIWIASMTTLALMYHAKSFDQATREKLFTSLSTKKPLRGQPGS